MTIAEEGPAGEVRHFGAIGGDLEAVAKLVRRLRRKHRALRFVYEALNRSEKLPAQIRAIAWKAQLRLGTRYRRLSARGKPQQVVVTAFARELVGFVWAIARAQNALL